jgi:hypothetical protein
MIIYLIGFVIFAFIISGKFFYTDSSIHGLEYIPVGIICFAGGMLWPIVLLMWAILSISKHMVKDIKHE